MRRLLFLAMVACSAPPPSAPPSLQAAPAAPVAPSTPTEGVLSAARAAVASLVGVSMEGVTVVSSEATEWPDACLGMAGPGEVCGQMMVSGWRVVVQAGEQRWTVRTDGSGGVVKVEPTPQ